MTTLDKKIENLKKIVNSADVISIDNSPLLTNWNSHGDIIIDAKYVEDELEYCAILYYDDITDIKFDSNSHTFSVFLDREVLNFKFYTLTEIGGVL